MALHPHGDVPVALVDANVLFSNDQRNVLVTFAVEGLIVMRGTARIEEEWVRNLCARFVDKNPASIRRTAVLIREALEDYILPPSLDTSVGKTDPKDNHVANSAIICAPSFLVTWNLKDFDGPALAASGVELTTPDDFLLKVVKRAPAAAREAFKVAASFAKGKTTEDYIRIVAERGHPSSLWKFAAAITSLDPDNAAKAIEETVQSTPRGKSK
jgi:hypothetical protein